MLEAKMASRIAVPYLSINQQQYCYLLIISILCQSLFYREFTIILSYTCIAIVLMHAAVQLQCIFQGSKHTKLIALQQHILGLSNLVCTLCHFEEAETTTYSNMCLYTCLYEGMLTAIISAQQSMLADDYSFPCAKARPS